MRGTLRFFDQVFNVVLEDEQIRFASAGEPDEALIVVFDHAGNFFAIGHLDANGSALFNQALQILGLFESLLWRARGFGGWWRSRSPERFVHSMIALFLALRRLRRGRPDPVRRHRNAILARAAISTLRFAVRSSARRDR